MYYIQHKYATKTTIKDNNGRRGKEDEKLGAAEIGGKYISTERVPFDGSG